MKNYIYKLVDPVNNIIGYIGETTNPEQRQQGHNSGLSSRFIPNLKFPVLSSADNWKLWLGYMGITPLLVVIDTIEGSKRDARALEGKYIAEYTQRGVRLSNNFHLAKEIPCPYTKLWSNVWQKYQALQPVPVSAKVRYPELLMVERELKQKLKLLNAIEDKIRGLAIQEERKYYSMASKHETAEREKAHANILSMFASEREKAKIIQLPLFPIEKAS